MKPAFEIGDVVYVEGHERRWFVIGVVMRPCYDLIAWEYHVGQAVYGDHEMSSFGSRIDVNTIASLREEQLCREEEWLKKRQAALQAEIKATEERLKALKAQSSDSQVEQEGRKKS